jgi:hypothetical protein
VKIFFFFPFSFVPRLLSGSDEEEEEEEEEGRNRKGVREAKF